jgi:hypothetical protein
MKISTLIVIIIFGIFLSCNSNRKANLPLNIDYQDFVGKPISDFLEHNNSYQNLQVIDRKPGVASSLKVLYPKDSITIELFPDGFKYMKQFDIACKWNIELFKKEKILIIRVIQSDRVIDVVPYKKEFFNPVD